MIFIVVYCCSAAKATVFVSAKVYQRQRGYVFFVTVGATVCTPFCDFAFVVNILCICKDTLCVCMRCEFCVLCMYIVCTHLRPDLDVSLA